MINLDKNQKYATGLLSTGTFLEYFDLMLYVHMTVLLNKLFFPDSDPKTASIIMAFSFCSTFLLRPFGALIFGYIGDTFGRKRTVILTTFLMAGSCLMMANLPTYEQIGITASWLVTLCRIVQGMSSMGEKVGAELYLTESTTPPLRYPLVALVNVFSSLGATAALSVATIVTLYGLNWRLAFWIGAGIALIGSVARAHLRETPEFEDAKRRQKKTLIASNQSRDLMQENPNLKEKVETKTIIAYFLLQCARPVNFYFIYVYCSDVLVKTFYYTPEQVIQHNLIVSIVDLLIITFFAFLSYYIYPLKIIKTILAVFSVSIVFTAYLLPHISNPLYLMLLQCFFCIVSIDTAPAGPIFLIHFPVFKRFTYSTFLYALSRALIYFVTAFGFVYVTDKYSNLGLLVIMVPITIGFTYGLKHFEKLEKAAGNYPFK